MQNHFILIDNTDKGIGQFDLISVSQMLFQAALNMISKCLSSDLKEDGILICLVHPGWVQTDIGGPNAKLSTTESVECEIRSYKCHYVYFANNFCAVWLIYK